MEETKILSILSDAYNIKFSRLKLLRKGGCTSYCVWSKEHKYFMKIIPSAFMDTAKNSLDILMYLNQYNFPVPHVILTKKGLSYVEIENSENKMFFSLFNFIEGREPNEGEDIEIIGSLIGQLHKLMERYEPCLPEHDKNFFINRYIHILRKKDYDEKNIKIFESYGNELWERVKELPRGFCHGDMHRGNILKTISGNHYLLDFDTSCTAFPVYDIMIMCNSTNYFDFDENGYEKSRKTYYSFLSGYTKHRTLSSTEFNAFYDLIAIYHYQLQATIIEIYGLDCVDNEFLDKQLEWLLKWHKQCELHN